MIIALVLALQLRNSPAPVDLPVDKAVEAALTANPELLDYIDQAALAGSALSAARAQFLPQLTPFLLPTFGQDGTSTTNRYGLQFSEQLPFGPRISGAIGASRMTGEDEWTSSYAATLAQPLLRGLDPAVSREPLRAARRLVAAQHRNLSIQKRSTVVAVWSAYLFAVLQDELLGEAAGRTTRAEHILAASHAKEEAGSVSRLDVLRAEQLVAQARSQENDAKNALEDAHDFLARLLGSPAGARFRLTPPETLPVRAPAGEGALSAGIPAREEIVEARERVSDAEVQLRIAKSLMLPSLDAALSWSATGRSGSPWRALGSPDKSSWTLGFSSQAPLNLGSQLATRNQAEISLRLAKRAVETLEADVWRAVRSAARRLETSRARLALDVANAEVARMQLEVAQLRFAKGLTDNFFVVDAEGLYNSARVSLLTSRQQVLLDELRLLSEAGLLRPEAFLPSAASPP